MDATDSPAALLIEVIRVKLDRFVVVKVVLGARWPRGALVEREIADDFALGVLGGLDEALRVVARDDDAIDLHARIGEDAPVGVEVGRGDERDGAARVSDDDLDEVALHASRASVAPDEVNPGLPEPGVLDDLRRGRVGQLVASLLLILLLFDLADGYPGREPDDEPRGQSAPDVGRRAYAFCS